MKRKLFISVITVLVVGLLALLFYYYSSNKTYNWTETYEQKSTEPFGTSLIAELLKEYTLQNKINTIDTPLRDALKKGNYVTPSNYVFLGNELYIDSAGIAALLNYVKEGNDAFISSTYLPEELMIALYDYKCWLRWEGVSSINRFNVNLNLYHEDLRAKVPYNFTLTIKKEKINYNWNYIPGTLFCDSETVFAHLGYLQAPADNYVNFFKAKYGKGNFYFHTTPIVFTNYFMVQKAAMNYAGAVFSHLNKRVMYWDEYSKVYQYQSDTAGNNKASNSPLKFIISQTALRWAWYLLLALTLVYLTFRVKRRQRIIPLTDPHANTSMEFIQTIGRLYFLQDNHQKLCEQKMKQFLIFVRSRYALPTNKLDADFIDLLHKKAQLPKEHITKIIQQYGWLSVTSTVISNNELIAFHQLIEYFYKNCN